MLKPTVSGNRSGFTLIEMLVVLAIMAVLGTAMVKLLLRQQRFYSSTSEMMQTRQQLRQAAFMLPADLRVISRVGDIVSMSDSSIDFRAVFGSSVACVINVAGLWVSTVPQTLARRSSMTNWKIKPAANDSVAIYDDAATIGAADDNWSLHRITAVVPVTGDNAAVPSTYGGCPSNSNLVLAADLTAGNPAYKISITTAPKATMQSGAAMRFFRRAHYGLYKWATDGQWYLGFYDCVPNRVPVCSAYQPVAGPLRPYAAPGSTSGFEMTYYDSTGAVTANKLLVARISLVVRAQGQSLINVSGGTAVPLRDSLRMEIGMRNRN